MYDEKDTTPGRETAAVSALNAPVRVDWRITLAKRIDALPPWGEMLVAAGVFGMLAMLTLWEANNAGQGIALLGKGTAPWWFAYAAGFAVTIGVVAAHRRGQEARRSGDKGKSRQWGSVALLLAVVSLAGVFSNLASKTGTSSTRASENNTTRAELIAEIRTLEAQTGEDQVRQLEAMIAANERIVAASLAEARGWGMADLDPEGACAADLRPRQRQLCNEVNGSVDAMGVRTELDLNRAALEGQILKQGQLEAARTELAGLRIEEGAEHWQAMSQLASTVGQEVSADWFRVFGSFLLSVFILVGVTWGWDAALETRENLEDD